MKYATLFFMAAVAPGSGIFSGPTSPCSMASSIHQDKDALIVDLVRRHVGATVCSPHGRRRRRVGMSTSEKGPEFICGCLSSSRTEVVSLQPFHRHSTLVEDGDVQLDEVCAPAKDRGRC
jgi:hypothetical protein